MLNIYIKLFINFKIISIILEKYIVIKLFKIIYLLKLKEKHILNFQNVFFLHILNYCAFSRLIRLRVYVSLSGDKETASL